jgi:hypothetical protein
MTRALVREEFRARTREELRARLMALVLTAVLVWYTLVVPPYAPAPRRAGLVPEDEGCDGEVRGIEGARPANKSATRAADVPVEELEWPEFIGLD